jgi:hypothetical protein
MKYVALIIITIVALTSCHHYSQGFEAYFCTSTAPGSKNYLYIDDEKIGLLPYVHDVPSCDDAEMTNRLLYSVLRAGSHLIQVKDIEGNIVFSERLKAGRRGRSFNISSSTKKRRWDSRIKVKDACLIADLRF